LLQNGSEFWGVKKHLPMNEELRCHNSIICLILSKKWVYEPHPWSSWTLPIHRYHGIDGSAIRRPCTVYAVV
jgi:hypothetical protein